MGIETNLMNAATFSQPDFYSTAIRTFSILSILLAVILIGSYLVRRLWPKGSRLMGNNRWIRVVAASYIAPKKTISLVEVAGEMLVLGLTDSQITMLTKISDEHTIGRLQQYQDKTSEKSYVYRSFKFFANGCQDGGEEGAGFLREMTSDSHEGKKTIQTVDMPMSKAEPL